MPSEIDVCNQALLALGAQAQVSTINPSDGSTEADACSQLYVPLREMLQRSALWAFARAQTTLSQTKAAIINGQPSSDPPPAPWQFEYAYPSDCLKIRFLLPIWNQVAINPPLMTGPQNMVFPWGIPGMVPFQIASDTVTAQLAKVILTNLPTAQAVYTRRIVDPDLWDPMFFQAMVSTLAAALVNPLARNAALFKDLVGVAASIVNQARVSDGNETPASQDHLPDFIAVRGVFGGYGTSPYMGGWDPFVVAGFAC